jgi:molybdate transport system ATP-binding protein
MRIDFETDLDRGGFRLQLAWSFAGSALGVCGPSGSGKTTLLHLLAGLIRPRRGRLVLDGVTLGDSSTRVHVPPHRRRIGLVFQHGHLFQHLSVESNLRYGERLVPRGEARIPFAQVIELLELQPLLGRRPAGLSGGERQRVALGRALLAAPRLLLLDEPLASLDQRLKRQILPYLQRINRELQVPLIYVSHDLTELRLVTDQALILDQGRLLAQGSFEELRNHPEVYGMLMPPWSDLASVGIRPG